MSVSHCKSAQISRTLLSILADFKMLVWMVSTCYPISNFSNPFNKPFGIVPSAITTIGITVTFKFYSFFSSLTRSKYFFSLSLIFTLWSARKGKAKQVLFFLFLFFFVFLLTISGSGLLAGTG